MENIFLNDMELNSTNIKRLVNIYKRYIERNWRNLLIRLLAYIYLFGAFGFIALYSSLNIRISTKPLGYFLVLSIILGFYLLYVIINHLLVRIVVSHKILFIFDLLTLIMLVCLFLSDMWTENYYQHF